MSNMLQRFSRNPSLRFSLSSFAQSIKGNNSKQEFSKEEIEEAIAEIKSLGKRAVDQQNATNSNIANTNTIDDIKMILKLMKKYQSNLYVQRVSCHALSNLAMQVVIARYIVSHNGFEYVRCALEKFSTDHKLCWLASSALWNMARPPANREIIGKAGVKLMLKILSLHYMKHEKVTNTAIGALSNLSLCESIKSVICKKDNILLILKVLNLYSSEEHRSISVMTSGAGLLANLAVSDDHAATLLQNNALPVIIQLLRWKSPKKTENNEDSDENENKEQENENSNENTLHRNSCAALNNMVTANHFVDKFLDCNGIETVYSYLSDTNNDLFIQLLENCLNALECDREHQVTTMHLCALHNRTDLLKKMIENASTIDKMDVDEEDESEISTDLVSVGSHLWGNKADTWTVKELLNQTDGNNMTPLQYAALGKHYELVEFLIKCGADSSVLDSNESSEGDSEDSIQHRSSISNAIKNAKYTVESIASQRKQAICNVLDSFPTDLCNFMQSFENNIDMLQVANKF